MAKKKPQDSAEPPADRAPLMEPLEDDLDLNLQLDEEMDQILQTMSARVCDYCESSVTWLDPADMEANDPQSFAEVVHRDGIDPSEIIMGWECDECANFALIGDGFEVQWMDDPAQCGACGSYELDAHDPAQVAHLDRAWYLAAKKEMGAQVLLSGTVYRCRACGEFTWEPPAEV